MVKKQQKRKKMTLIEAPQSTKKFFMMFTIQIFIFILCVNLVSGADWDNIKSYDSNKKEVTITNLLGFGEELFKASLLTPHTVMVIDRGENVLQKVGEFEITNMNKDDFKYTFGEVKTYNKQTMKEFGREVVYRYRVITQEYQVPVMQEIDEENSEILYYETHYKFDWIDFKKFSDLPEGNVVIGVFVDVLPNEMGEWIPTFYGREVDEWAVWNTGYNNNLTAYFPLNETSGTDALDVDAGHFNGTYFNGTIDNVGVLGKAYAMSDANNSILNLSEFGLEMYNNGTKNFTLSFWMNLSAVQHLGFFWSYGYDDTYIRIAYHTDNKMHFSGCSGSPNFNLNTGVTPINDEFTHIVAQFTEDGTGQARIWINGTLIATDNAVDDCDSNENSQHHGFGKSPMTASTTPNMTLDEIGFWDRYLNQSEIEDLYNGGLGIAFEQYTRPYVTLSRPDDNYERVWGLNVTFEINTTTTNTNLVNVTLNINGTANETKSISGTSASTLFYKTPLRGSYVWNASVCDDSVCIDGDAFRNFDVVSAVLNEETYNNETMEGGTERFTINFTKSSLLTVSTVNLVYNGTENSLPYTVIGNDVIANGTIVIPQKSQTTNVSFFWNVSFTDNTYFNTSVHNQTIIAISMDNCTDYSNILYNFTHYDEGTKDFLTVNNTIEVTLNLYNLGKTTLLSNFSQVFYETNPVTICLNTTLLDTVNYSSYVTVKYFANLTVTNKSYSTEYYNILNQTLGNGTVPNHIKLYDLREKDTTKFRLTFRDSDFDLAPNILVQVHRQYVDDNEFKIVEIPLTDSNGQTILNLVRDDVVYNFIMVNEAGETIATFNSLKAFCQDYTIGQCVINLNAPPSIEDIYNRDDTFGVYISNLTYNNVSKEVSFNFLTDDLLPKTFSISVFRNNFFGNRSVCTNSLTSASGLISCDVSSITDSDQFLFVDIYVDGVFYSTETINLNTGDFVFKTSDGAFYAFLLMLLLVTFFIEDKKVLLASLVLGWVTILSLGLLRGKFIGIGSAGIWLLVSIIVFIWKLNKEENP